MFSEGTPTVLDVQQLPNLFRADFPPSQSQYFARPAEPPLAFVASTGPFQLYSGPGPAPAQHPLLRQPQQHPQYGSPHALGLFAGPPDPNFQLRPAHTDSSVAEINALPDLFSDFCRVQAEAANAAAAAAQAAANFANQMLLVSAGRGKREDCLG